MHPEIERFWNRKIFRCKDPGIGKTGFLYYYMDASGIQHIVAEFNNVTTYYWDNKKYSEEEMLKIIKLKAFI